MDTVKFLLYFSDFIVPFTMFYIVVYGFFNRTDVYESFLKGGRRRWRGDVPTARCRRARSRTPAGPGPPAGRACPG